MPPLCTLSHCMQVVPSPDTCCRRTSLLPRALMVGAPLLAQMDSSLLMSSYASCGRTMLRPVALLSSSDLRVQSATNTPLTSH